MDYRSYVADLHLNLHPEQLGELERWYEHCRRVSDFFTLAYYPYEMVEAGDGFRYEREISPELREGQWEAILAFLERREAEDGFICFPGFEWQGTGEDGDHNVYLKTSGPIELPPRYEGLREAYRGRDAIAIPHHLAYALGHRGKNWDTHDEAFSPVAEVYSHHGSSERDATALPMGRHVHMGPRVDDTSVVAGLKRGRHVGLICSGDNHAVPALTWAGRAGLWARDYSKDALWEALLARRTFGFTGPRIELWCEAEGHPLGSAFATGSDEVELEVSLRANAKVERLELYRDGDIDAVHVVPWHRPEGDGPIRFKFRVEFGWGPSTRLFPEATERLWEGTLTTPGTVVSMEPVFSGFDTRHAIEDAHTVSFAATSRSGDASYWERDGALRNEGFVFEIEAPLESSVTLEVAGERFEWPVGRILAGSFLEVFEAEAKELVARASVIESFYRGDAWYHNAYKLKVHQGFASDLYELRDSFVVRPSESETSWFVKAVQADGQTAWASPLWIARA